MEDAVQEASTGTNVKPVEEATTCVQAATDVTEVSGQEATSGQCAICLEREATVVASPCGHLVCCVACRRRIVHEARVISGASADTAGARRNLSTKQLERTKVPCPICRAESTLGLHQRYDGQIFISGHHVEVGDDEAGDDQVQPASEGYCHQEAPSSEAIPPNKTEPFTPILVAEDDASDQPQSASTAKLSREMQLQSRIQKLWEYSTTTLINDQGMDCMLGGSIYRFMQSDDFIQKMFLGLKTTTKCMTKRRALKIKMVPSLRLDGRKSNGGDLAISVGQLEEYEKVFGKTVTDMLREVVMLKKEVITCCTKYGWIDRTQKLQELLERYLRRHTQRTADLQHMIQNGVLPEDEGDRRTEGMEVRIPQAQGMTTFLLDGAQVSTMSALADAMRRRGRDPAEASGYLMQNPYYQEGG